MPHETTARPLRPITVVIAFALAVAGCGDGQQSAAGGDDATSDRTQPLSVEASVATNPLTVGWNRIAFGLVGEDGTLVADARVDARLFVMTEDADGELRGELVSEHPLSPIELPQDFEHRHADGSDHDHSGPVATVYATEVELPSSEWWGAELVVEIDGDRLAPMMVPFWVDADTPEPAFGEVVPAIEQITTDDTDDIGLIDSSDPPHPEWHDITVADALALDRPLVIAFATGAFCQTRFCGPVIEGVIGPLSEQYGDRAEFIVIEPFDLEAARSGELVPVPEMAQWGLDSEPWVFVTDAEGRVTGKFQGITSEAEVGAALEGVLGG